MLSSRTRLANVKNSVPFSEQQLLQDVLQESRMLVTGMLLISWNEDVRICYIKTA